MVTEKSVRRPGGAGIGVCAGTTVRDPRTARRRRPAVLHAGPGQEEFVSGYCTLFAVARRAPSRKPAVAGRDRFPAASVATRRAR